MLIPKNWPREIKTILNTLSPDYRSKIVDFINLSHQAGFFDGEGTFQWVTVIPQITSQNIECLQLFKDRHGGHISLQHKKGKRLAVYVNGKKVSGAYMNVNKDCYVWTMTGRIKGRQSRSYVDKTNFLLSILPLQHNQSKIKDTIKALLVLGWSSRERWEHLIPKINDPNDFVSSDDITIRKMLDSGMEDVREWFE